MSDFNLATSTVISVAQSLLAGDKEKGTPTAELISQRVDAAMALVSMTNPDPIDREGAIGELIRRFSLWIGKDAALSDSSDHVVWLNSARKRGWRYWARYRDMLEKQTSMPAVEAIDDSTDRVLGYLEDPHREGAWDRRGLVVGHVQSGKTANYSGLICKAADAGYKIIIVLAGLHNNLRAQTQIRLEEGFLGFETSAAGEIVKLVGVGENGRDFEIKPNCATNRHETGDFNTKVAKHLAITPEERPWLFVVKKQKTVLERLLKWIQSHVADSTDLATKRRFVSNLPLLLIDDEADHASVDTGEQTFDADGRPDDDHQPKTINSLIRKILHSFSKKAYVGYTATPFANIFIHRHNFTAEEGPDLFPQSFIVNLGAPDNYVGPARVFGRKNEDGRSDGLPLVRIFDDHASEDLRSGWMPPKHSKIHVPTHKGQEIPPESLQKAVYSFVLACAAREARGQAKKHSSMLIHVTRYNDVQAHVRDQVQDLIKKMRQRVTRNIGHEDLIADLRELWESDFEPTTQTIVAHLAKSEEVPLATTWEEVYEKLPDTIADIKVMMINGKAKEALVYAEDAAKGARVIAIGGEKLARGLTLEGLCTSYFVRTTKMYDTLMQMGRWFGYRPGYLDLCRLYTTEELVEWFEHITDASEELRQEFDAMTEIGATPREYGLRVESHPVLLVTSPLKMRTAKDLQLSFSGEILETVTMHADESIANKNIEATNRLLAACGPSAKVDPERMRAGSRNSWTGYLWDAVSSEAIADFFDHFTTHPRAHKVKTFLIRDFVRSMASHGELTSWTVMLMGGGEGGPYTFAGNRSVKMQRRKANPDLHDRYSIGRLVSPRDEAIDLDESAWDEALEITIAAWEKAGRRARNGQPVDKPTTPSGPSIRFIRGKGSRPAPERGVLLIYPLDPQEASAPKLFGARNDPVIAIGVSFPNSDSGVKVTYAVDHLRWAQEYGQAD